MKLFLSTLCLGGAAAAASTDAEQKSATPLAPVADTIEVIETSSPPAGEPRLASTAPQDDDDERELARAADDLEKELAKLRAELAEMRAKLGDQAKGTSMNEERRRRLTEIARTSERAAAERAKAEAEIARTKARAAAEKAKAEVEIAMTKARAEAERAQIERRIARYNERQEVAEQRTDVQEVEAKLRAVEAEVARVRARDAREGARAGRLQRAEDAKAAVQAQKEAIERTQELLRAQRERVRSGGSGSGSAEEVVEIWNERLAPGTQLRIVDMDRTGDRGAYIVEQAGPKGGVVRRGVAPDADMEQFVWRTTIDNRAGSTQGEGSNGGVTHRVQGVGGPARAPQAPPAPQGGGQTIHINVEEGDVHIHSNGAQIHTSKSSSGGGKSKDVSLFGRITGKDINASGSNSFFEKGEGGPSPRGFRFRFGTDDEDGHEHEHEIHEEHEHEHEAHEAHEHGVTMKGLPKGSYAIGVGTDSGLGGIMSLNIESIEDLESTFDDIDFEFDEIAEIAEIEHLFAEPIEIETIQELRTNLPELGVVGKVLERGDVELEFSDGAKVESKVILIESDGGEPRTMIFRNGKLIEGEMPKGVDVPVLKSIPMIKQYLDVEEIEETEEIEEEPGSVVYLKQRPKYSGAGSTLGVDISPGTGVGYARLNLPPNGLAGGAAPADDDLIQLAREIRDELRAMRAELSALRAEISGAGGHSSAARAPRTPGPRAPRAPRQPRAPRATGGFPAPSAPDAPAPAGTPGTGAGSFPGPTPPSAPSAPEPRTGAGTFFGAVAPEAPQPARAPSPFGLGSGRR